MGHELKFIDFSISQRAPVTVVRRDPQPPYPLHFHEFAELVIVYEGEGCHFTDKFAHQVVAGDCFIIDRQYNHGYRDIKNLKLVNIMYDPDSLLLSAIDIETLPIFKALFFFEPKFREKHGFKSHLRLKPEQLAASMSMIGKMEKESSGQRTGSSIVLTGLFLQLVGFLTRCYADDLPCMYKPLLDVGKVISYLESHYPKPVTLSKLVHIANMTERTLTRHFKKATGLTPIEYYQHLCIGRACELLKNSDKTISEVAFETGFSDSNYFSRQFKKIIGQTPRNYRNTR
jgi:AraC-like DNA-binding protein